MINSLKGIGRIYLQTVVDQNIAQDMMPHGLCGLLCAWLPLPDYIILKMRRVAFTEPCYTDIVTKY